VLIDAYAHVSARKYKPAEILLRDMDGAGVGHAVIVQPLNDFDNSYLEEVGREQRGRFTCIALLDPTVSNPAGYIQDLICRRRFSGVRVDARCPGLDPFFSELAQLSAAVMLHLPDGIGAHIAEIERIARQWPNLRICLPHLGWPRDADGPTRDWADGLTRLSLFPNAAVVVSALYYFSRLSFPHEDTGPWIDHALACFGPERTMLGSDFPLLLEASGYADYFAYFSPRISADAARRFWRIGSESK